ncbi:MAG: hypothetical protein ABEI06_10570 [Halobacteriaceae archaeon]
MSQEPSPANTMRERAGSSRFKLWLLIEAHRLIVVIVLLIAIFVSLVIIGHFSPVGPSLFQKQDPIETLFQAFIGATITGVTLVLTLNQLVLSQELGSVGDQRSRMEGAMTFREDVESYIESQTSPPEPASFFQDLIAHTKTLTENLQDTISDETDPDLTDNLNSIISNIQDNASTVENQLESAQFGTFDVLSAALNFNYSWKIYQTRHILNDFEGELTETQDELLQELLETLELFGPTREHFKTLYIQWELINLSRVIISAAVPAIIISVSMVLFVDLTDISGQIFGLSQSILGVSLGVTLALSPFIVLLVYIMRIATITKRTLSIGSFTLRKTSR